MSLAYCKDFCTQRGGQSVQLVSAEPIAATSPAKPSLSRLCASPVDQMTPVAQERRPRRIGPDPGSLPVLATVHAIVNPHKGQIGHDRACLQLTCIGVLNKPQCRLQPPNKIQTAQTNASALSRFRGVFALVRLRLYCVQSGLAQTTSK